MTQDWFSQNAPASPPPPPPQPQASGQSGDWFAANAPAGSASTANQTAPAAHPDANTPVKVIHPETGLSMTIPSSLFRQYQANGWEQEGVSHYSNGPRFFSRLGSLAKMAALPELATQADADATQSMASGAANDLKNAAVGTAKVLDPRPDFAHGDLGALSPYTIPTRIMKGMAQGHVAEYRAAKDEANKGNTAAAMLHSVNAAVPLAGDLASGVYEAERDNPGAGVGVALSRAAQVAVPGAGEAAIEARAARPPLARAIPTITPETATVAAPYIKAAADEMGVNLKSATAKDVSNVISSAQKTIKARVAEGDLSPEQEALAQSHVDALDAVQNGIDKLQAKANANAAAGKTVPDRKAGALQTGKGIAKSAGGVAVATLIPGIGGELARLLGLKMGLPDIAAGTRELVRPTPLMQEGLDTRLQGALDNTATPAGNVTDRIFPQKVKMGNQGEPAPYRYAQSIPGLEGLSPEESDALTQEWINDDEDHRPFEEWAKDKIAQRVKPLVLDPEYLGTVEDPNVLARRQGVRVQPQKALPAPNLVTSRGLLPERTPIPLPDISDSGLQESLNQRSLEAVAATPEAQSQALRAFLKRNPNPTPVQAQSFVDAYRQRYGQAPDIGGLADPLNASNQNPITNPIRPKSTLPKWAKEVQDYENQRAIVDALNEQDSWMQQRAIQDWIAKHNVQPKPFQSKGLKTRDVQPQGNLIDLLQRSIEQANAGKGAPAAAPAAPPAAASGLPSFLQSMIDQTKATGEPTAATPVNPAVKPLTIPDRLAVEGNLRRAGFEPMNFNKELGTVSFVDPANTNRPMLMSIDEAKAANPADLQAKMKAHLQSEPPRAERVAKQNEQPSAQGTARNPSVNVPAASLQKGDVAFVDPREIKLDPQRFQFKQQVNERGVTNQFAGLKFDPFLAGSVDVFKDPQTGELFAANGHHRTALAQDSNSPSMLVHVMETDSPKVARARAALKNIADGKGTGFDAAVFMRDSGLTPDELRQQNISLSEPKVQTGMALARLDPEILRKVGTGQLSEARGAAIGAASESPAIQEGILNEIAKREAKGKNVSDAMVTEMARVASHVGADTQNVLSLFGPEQQTRSLIGDFADVSSSVRREISSDKSVFGQVASKGKAERLSKGGNVIDPETNQQISRRAAQKLELFDRESLANGSPVNKILIEAARRIRNGENASTVKTEVQGIINSQLDQTLSTLDPGGEGPGLRGDTP
jgi:hypothetical protein